MRLNKLIDQQDESDCGQSAGEMFGMLTVDEYELAFKVLLGTLPRRRCEVLLLALKGHSQSEIACELGTHRGAINQHIKKIRKALEVLIEDPNDRPPPSGGGGKKKRRSRDGPVIVNALLPLGFVVEIEMETVKDIKPIVSALALAVLRLPAFCENTYEHEDPSLKDPLRRSVAARRVSLRYIGSGNVVSTNADAEAPFREVGAHLKSRIVRRPRRGQDMPAYSAALGDAGIEMPFSQSAFDDASQGLVRRTVLPS